MQKIRDNTDKLVAPLHMGITLCAVLVSLVFALVAPLHMGITLEKLAEAKH